MSDILKYIPGFRSGKKYKKIIAAIYYIFALTMLTEGIGIGLFSLAIPFLIFSFMDLIRHKKKSQPLKKALIPVIASSAILIIGMSISPTPEFTEAEGQLIAENEVEEDEAVSNDSLDGETEEIEETLDQSDSKDDETGNNNDDSEQESEPQAEDIEEASTEEETKETSSPSVQADGKFEVHFIDVGQGDASLIICDGKAMLIDGGNPRDSNVIYAYLKKNDIKHLDYIVNTHPHADHVGGLSGALNYATVGKAFSSVTSYDTKAFDSFVKYLQEQNVSITVPNAGDKFTLGSSTVEVLSGTKGFNDVNNDSIVLKITYGNTSFLFTGDAEREAEQALVDSGADLSSTVLHVGHHGSDTSTTYPFLREVMPDYGVISVGSNNSYGHPTEGVLSKLRDGDVKVLRTDMQGDIIFTSDGRDVSFTTNRNTNVDTLASVPKVRPTTTPKETSAPTSKETTSPTPKETSAPTSKETTSPTQSVVSTESTAAETTAPSSRQQEELTESKYMLNTNSKKIHYSSCPSVKRMSDKNKQESDLSRGELINQGYDPCGNCKP